MAIGTIDGIFGLSRTFDLGFELFIGNLDIDRVLS